jgi:hypothetical protein
MRVIICAMAKKEHLYINEWVKHYFSMGFDKIYLYDNDELEDDYIGNYIDKKYLPRVEIINIRGIKKEKLQQEVYENFYNTHNFDWCLFCDIDEYLMGICNIKLWLEQYKLKYAKQIRVKWKLFGDDDLITRNMNKPLYEVFKREVKSTLSRGLNGVGSLENQGKAFVRGGLNNVVIKSPHFASFKTRENVIPSVLPSGKPCWSKIVINENYSKENVYLYHYMTKSLSEFINQKLNRNDAVFNQKLTLDYYWRINKKTKEKLDYLKNMGLE